PTIREASIPHSFHSRQVLACSLYFLFHQQRCQIYTNSPRNPSDHLLPNIYPPLPSTPFQHITASTHSYHQSQLSQCSNLAGYIPALPSPSTTTNSRRMYSRQKPVYR